MLLGVFYIGNAHNAERTMREIKKMKSENRELKARHIAAESELKVRGSKSAMEAEMAKKGLKQQDEVPERIIIQKDNK